MSINFEYQYFVLERFKMMGSTDDSILHAAIGVAGEGGEMLDAAKKTWVYGKPRDDKNLIEEAGDALFYIQALANIMGLTLEDFMLANMEKLQKRYPTGYTDQHAIARMDKIEEK